MLRNQIIVNDPLLPIFQQAYPGHIYVIESREIKVLSDSLVNVTIEIKVYNDELKTFQFDHPVITYDLVNLPNNPAQLNPAAYETALKDQYPDAWLDGAQIKDFLSI